MGIKKYIFLLFLLFSFFLNFKNLLAFDDEFFFEDIDTNYSFNDNKNSSDLSEKEENLKLKNFSFNGSFSQEFVYGLDDTDPYFIRNKKSFDEISNSLFLSLEGKLSDRLKIKISGTSKLNWGNFEEGEFVLSGIKQSSIMNDVYFDYNTDEGIWVRLGNQVIARGEVDSIISTDIINPRDFSRPGQSELDEIRKPIPAFLISFPFKSSKIEFISVGW